MLCIIFWRYHMQPHIYQAFPHRLGWRFFHVIQVWLLPIRQPYLKPQTAACCDRFDRAILRDHLHRGRDVHQTAAFAADKPCRFTWQISIHGTRILEVLFMNHFKSKPSPRHDVQTDTLHYQVITNPKRWRV